jgi:hypothetical protein
MINSASEPHLPGRSPLLVLALAALGTMLVAACGETAVPSSPPITASTTPPASASTGVPELSPTTIAGSADESCTSTDLQVTGGPWGGAAGSRGTDVVVENRGSSSCRLPAGPVVAILGSTGSVLLQSRPTRVGQGPTIGPNGAISFSLVVSNWCDESLTLPLRFQLALTAGTIEIAGVSVASRDELPPCNGPGQPASLSTTSWESR